MKTIICSVLLFGFSGCTALGSELGLTTPPPEQKQPDPPIVVTQPDEPSFAEAEPLLAKVAEKWAKRSKHEIEIRRTYTLMDDWAMSRDEDTHVILSRVVRAAVYTKDQTEHKCYQMLCNLEEEAQGPGQWGKATLDCPIESVATCKSVNALAER
jgi:hypothetical protein